MMFRTEKRKLGDINDMESYNKLSERVKDNRGAFFSKLIIKADGREDVSEINYVLSHVFYGTGCGSDGDLDHMSRGGLTALQRYDCDIDGEDVREISISSDFVNCLKC